MAYVKMEKWSAGKLNIGREDFQGAFPLSFFS